LSKKKNVVAELHRIVVVTKSELKLWARMAVCYGTLRKYGTLEF